MNFFSNCCQLYFSVLLKKNGKKASCLAKRTKTRYVPRVKLNKNHNFLAFILSVRGLDLAPAYIGYGPRLTPFIVSYIHTWGLIYGLTLVLLILSAGIFPSSEPGII